MKRETIFALLLPIAAVLGGCVASVAASALGAAVSAGRGTPKSNEGSNVAAVSQCSAQAARYGVVHIIDVEQRSINRLVVWGTAGAGEARQSFECAFGTKITSFRIRPIGPSR